MILMSCTKILPNVVIRIRLIRELSKLWKNINDGEQKKVHYRKDVQGSRGADLCEGGGFAYRLRKEPKIIQDLARVFKSKEMESAMRDKFNLLSEDVSVDVGLQKYTHGYEISPHPDT